MAALRKAISAAIGYTNAGTVEFLMDEGQALLHRSERAHAGGASGDRVRDRHRLVKSQIRIAQGERWIFSAGRWNCAATPSSAASTPRIRRPSCRRPAASPASICRAASACAWTPRAYTDCVIPPYYDSLVAKLIAYGKRPRRGHRRMRARSIMFIVEGIHTSIPLHQRILADEDFQAPAASIPTSSKPARASQARSAAGQGHQGRLTQAEACATSWAEAPRRLKPALQL
jgi:acetyl-CoA carboxylase, biotin carboxylase subunit